MSAKVYGKNFHFGLGWAGKLPEGWKLVEAPDDFTFAVSPLGEEYILADTHAYPWREATAQDEIRTDGRLKVGDRFVDDRSGVVKLPTD